jgi:hypothetical protein
VALDLGGKAGEQRKERPWLVRGEATGWLRAKGEEENQELLGEKR